MGRTPQIITLGFAVALLMVPLGMALDRSDQVDDRPTVNGFDRETLNCPESQLSVCDEPVEPAVGIPGSSDGAAELGYEDPPTGDVYHISAPSDQMITDCTSGERPEGECGQVLAMAEGKLEPGSYSERELERRIAAAGYEWNGR